MYSASSNVAATVAALVAAGVDPSDLDVLVDVWVDKKGITHLDAGCRHMPRKKSAPPVAGRRLLLALADKGSCGGCHALWWLQDFAAACPPWVVPLRDADLELGDLAKRLRALDRVEAALSGETCNDDLCSTAALECLAALTKHLHYFTTTRADSAMLQPAFDRGRSRAVSLMREWMRQLRDDDQIAALARQAAREADRDRGEDCLLGVPHWGGGSWMRVRNRTVGGRLTTDTQFPLAVATLAHFSIGDPAGASLLASVPGEVADWLIDALGDVPGLDLGGLCDLPADRMEILTHLWPDTSLTDAVRFAALLS